MPLRTEALQGLPMTHGVLESAEVGDLPLKLMVGGHTSR